MNYFFLGSTLLYTVDFSIHQTLLDIINSFLVNADDVNDLELREGLIPLAEKLDRQNNNYLRRLLWQFNPLGSIELLTDLTVVVAASQRHAYQKLVAKGNEHF
jgi:hypothetical protein